MIRKSSLATEQVLVKENKEKGNKDTRLQVNII